MDVLLSHAGDESYELYAEERNGIFTSLGYRAQLLVDGLNKLPGITCNPSEGAMYAVRELDSSVFSHCVYKSMLTRTLSMARSNSSPRSTCRRRPSMRRRLGAWNQISSTARPCSTPPASALSQVRVKHASVPTVAPDKSAYH